MEKSNKGRSIHSGGYDGFGRDILQRIFSRLPPISLAYCSAVCSSWHHVIDTSPSLWRIAYLLGHKRSPSRRSEPESAASSSEKTDADCRGCYVEEELRTRLAHGRVSVRSWKAHSGRVNCCRMAMGLILSGSSDQTVRIWSAKTLKCTEQYKVPTKAPVIQVEFDENKVMGAAGTDVVVWSRRGSRRLLRRMDGHSEICSFCDADSDLAMGCADGTVRVFDLYSGRCTQIFRLHTEPVKAVVMDVINQALASGSGDGTVQLFDARSGQKIASLIRPSSMTGITSLHLKAMDCKLFAGTLGGDVYCFDLRSRKTIWKTRVAGVAVTCLHSPIYSNSTIGVGGMDGAVKVFDVDSIERIGTFQAKPSRLPSSPVLGMALGMTKLVTSHADSSMLLWGFDESQSVSAEIEAHYGRREIVALL